MKSKKQVKAFVSFTYDVTETVQEQKNCIKFLRASIKTVQESKASSEVEAVSSMVKFAHLSLFVPQLREEVKQLKRHLKFLAEYKIERLKEEEELNEAFLLKEFLLDKSARTPFTSDEFLQYDHAVRLLAKERRLMWCDEDKARAEQEARAYAYKATKAKYGR